MRVSRFLPRPCLLPATSPTRSAKLPSFLRCTPPCPYRNIHHILHRALLIIHPLRNRPCDIALRHRRPRSSRLSYGKRVSYRPPPAPVQNRSASNAQASNYGTSLPLNPLIAEPFLSPSLPRTTIIFIVFFLVEDRSMNSCRHTHSDLIFEGPAARPNYSLTQIYRCRHCGSIQIQQCPPRPFTGRRLDFVPGH